MRVEGEWQYSYNELYRLSVVTAEIQTRPVKTCRQWKPLRDRDRHRIPKAIRQDFDLALEATRAIFRGSQNAQSRSQSAHTGSHNAHLPFNDDIHPTPHLRL